MVFNLNISVSLTRKEAEYLVFVYRKQVEDLGRVTTTIVARKFNVTAATITESFHKLAEKNFVEYIPSYGIRLTKKGAAGAQKLLRKHRLLETLFVRLMKYSPIEACNEASRIDYYCSEALANSNCNTYNYPAQCPCKTQIYIDPDYMLACKNDRNSAAC